MADEVNKNTNIIILDAYEEFVTWLDPEKVEIVETNKESTQRTISISYPLESNINGKTTPWFAQGNKIYIPSTLGIDSCLYVINTTYSIDYWEKNQVTVSAEEVLTEFNYMMFEYVDSTPLPINDTNLDKWFGDFYTIGKSDSIDSNKNTITPAGTMTKMSLLRLIEETTGYIFVREYTTDENNIISRKLTLKRSDNVGTLQTEYIDLNRNVESMELDVDESSTYNAMAPVLSLQNNTVSTTTDTVTSSASSSISTTQSTASSDTSTSRAELKKILTTWKNLSVEYRQKIPMIIETQTDGSVKYTAEWYAPYTKREGDLYISDPTYSNMNYNQIIPQSTKGVKINPLGKIGTATTSEKDPYAIYNVLANKLSEHRTPQFTLKISVKDIQLILGADNLGYSLYDSLYVRIPGFDYYVKCLVTETKKNLHLPGENTITLSSTVTGTHIQEATSIIANDQIVNQNNPIVNIGGYLNDINKLGVPNELITLSIELIEAYKSIPNNSTGNNTSTTTSQEVLDFHPEKEGYYFTNAEILNMSYIIRNYTINNGKHPLSVKMQAVDGKIYRVPFDWCRAIWYSRNDYFILTDMDLKSGKFSATTYVEYKHTSLDEMYKFLNTNENYRRSPYWANWYYLFIQENRKEIQSKNPKSYYSDNVTSIDKQTGGDCVPTSFAGISLELYDYVMEEEFAKLLKTVNWKPETGGEGTNPKNFVNARDKGFNVFWVEATWNNLKKYTTDTSRVVMDVYSQLLPAYGLGQIKNINYSRGHCIHANNYIENGDGSKYVNIVDSNMPLFTPYMMYKFAVNSWKTNYMSWDTLYNALKICKIPNRSTLYDWHGTTDKHKYKVFCVVQLTSKNSVTGVRQYNSLTDKTFNPDAMEYKFSSTELKRVYKQYRYDACIDKYAKEATAYSYDVKDTQGNTWKINGKWIISMIQAYLYTYKGKIDTATQTEKIITVNQNSASKYFYNVYKTSYDWSNFFYSSGDKFRRAYYTICEACYRLGTIIFPSEVYKKYPISDTGEIKNTVTGYTTIIKKIIKEDQNKTINSKQVTVNTWASLKSELKDKYYAIGIFTLNKPDSTNVLWREYTKKYNLDNEGYDNAGHHYTDTTFIIINNSDSTVDIKLNYLKGNDPDYKPYITHSSASDIVPIRRMSFDVFQNFYNCQQDADKLTIISFQTL